MDSLFILLFLASFVLLLIGLFSPKTSLFWDKKERTKKRSAFVYGVFAVVFFILFGVTTDEIKKGNNKIVQVNEVKKTIDIAPKATNNKVVDGINPELLFESKDDFSEAFNNFSASNKLAFRINSLKVTDGEVNNSFQYMFTDNLGIIGTLNKESGGIKEIMMIGTGNGTFESGSILIMCMVSIIGITNPTLEPKNRAIVLKKLGFLGNKKVDITDMSESTILNGVKYYAISSPQMGFMFGATKNTASN